MPPESSRACGAVIAKMRSIVDTETGEHVLPIVLPREDALDDRPVGRHIGMSACLRRRLPLVG